MLPGRSRSRATRSIPEKLKLSALPDLTGWLADEYGEAERPMTRNGTSAARRSRAGCDENHAGSKQESVLRYHRPMLEDGRIDYEFYFDPGKVMVHPAIDRLAFLIEPERRQDPPTDRRRLRADRPGRRQRLRRAARIRRGTGSIPLKPQAWNRLALRLAGDKVTIELNGQPIFERRLEPENQRTFGLFHYADETQVRVRNVTYEGNWPRAAAGESAAGGGEQRGLFH